VTGILLCLVAGAACFILASRSLLRGLQSVLTVGYFYGIIRANYFDTASHFLFDAAVSGFYLGIGSRFFANSPYPQVQQLQRWLGVLLLWPIIMALLPLQHYLVQLVGLRGNAFFIPFVLCGCWLNRFDALKLVFWIAIMNLVALGFSMAEFVLGVERFYPDNASTDLIYRSRDATAAGDFRIPSIFPHAHGYASTMLLTIPWLLGTVAQPGLKRSQRVLLFGGLFAAIMGAFLTATRMWLPAFMILLMIFLTSGQIRGGVGIGFLLLVLIALYFMTNEARLDRFTTLLDADQVAGRIYGSVNLGFFDLLNDYPLGNGIGAGGTSLPYFLEKLVTERVGMENEYSRILLEQGLPGLLMWLTFIGWFVIRPFPHQDSWGLCRRLLWYSTILSFLFAILGTGLMVSIPGSMMLFLGIGFCFTGGRLPANRPFVPQAIAVDSAKRNDRPNPS
jgi:hypothetical protein